MKTILSFMIIGLFQAAGVSQACVDLPQNMPVVVASAAYRTSIAPVSPATSLKDTNVNLEFVHVTGGCYCMGVNPGEGLRDTSPAHQVCVDDYYIGKYEVTQGQWREIMGNYPSSFSSCGDNCPVVDVSWNEAQEFIRRLSERTGKAYRLPTEAEWEYAVRTGGAQEKSSAASIASSEAKRVLHPVGLSEPNSLGIHDMQGSVWEWTGDWYKKNYYGDSPQYNPEGPTAGMYKVLRGGSWDDKPQSIQPTARVRYAPSIKRPWVGFRLISPDQYSANYKLPEVLVQKQSEKLARQCGGAEQQPLFIKAETN